MYVYLIKSSIYYKIGFSKNPNSRLKTIKTHNPFEVVLLATLKTDNYLQIEKELHGYFSNKNSKREWFELNEDDLIHLKVHYGFSFKIPINNIDNNTSVNSYILDEVKSIRIDNTKIDYFVSYFEDLFNCNIQDKKNIKRCCNKFDSDIIKKAIDDLYNQDNDEDYAYNILYKVCGNIKQSMINPELYFVKVVKAIFYKQYSINLSDDEIKYLEQNYNKSLDVNDVIKTINSKKFYMDENEFWKYIADNYMFLL